MKDLKMNKMKQNQNIQKKANFMASRISGRNQNTDQGSKLKFNGFKKKKKK